MAGKDKTKSTAAIDKLNDQQRAFVLHYMGDCRYNATKAALASGYTDNGPGSAGSTVLKNSNVREAIREELENASLTPEAIKQKLTAMATANVAQYEPYLCGAMTLKELDASGVDCSMIESVEEAVDEKGNVKRKIKLYSAKACMDSLIRVLGMVEDVIRHKGAEGGAINIVLQEAVKPKE